MLCLSAGLFALIGTAPVAASAAGTTYYFHGAGSPTDDINRVSTEAGGTESATFDTKSPTGTSDSTQTAVADRGNMAFAGNPLTIYWLGKVPAGFYRGTLHLDWWWEAPSPTDSLFTPNQVNIAVFGDVDPSSGSGTPLSAVVTVPLNPGSSSPVENKADVSIKGDVKSNLVIQVQPASTNEGVSDTAHYDSTSAASFFTLPLPTAPPKPAAKPTAIVCSTLCFSKPVVLPASGDTGGTSNTCFSPCGEPSLAVSPVDGTLYVSTPRTIVVCCNTQASPVWRSDDGGATWSQPIFPSAPESATTGGDTELAIDKRGTVYEGELWLGSDSIYISPDKGSTWSWSPASHDVGADREWFVYAPGEDALYGWYDGFKGLMVVKAPLTTPLGTNAALFFPIERVVVPECVDQAVSCPPLPVNSVAGVPVLPGDTSPGRPTVAPDGTLYFPFPYQVAGQGIGIASTSDGGQTYQYSYVSGAGRGVFGDTARDWPVTAVDSAGTLYAAWVEDKGDGFNVYYAASSDKGQTWTAPIELSKGVSKTAVFPNIVAGAPGQIAVSWYGTTRKGDNNDTKAMNGAYWDVDVSQVLDATAAKPRITTTMAERSFHTGTICTQGTACTGDSRKLLDFFDMKLDRDGKLMVVYARDLGDSKTEIAFSRQTTGCALGAPCLAESVQALQTRALPFTSATAGGLVLLKGAAGLSVGLGLLLLLAAGALVRTRRDS